MANKYSFGCGEIFALAICAVVLTAVVPKEAVLVLIGFSNWAMFWSV